MAWEEVCASRQAARTAGYDMRARRNNGHLGADKRFNDRWNHAVKPAYSAFCAAIANLV